MLALRLLSGVHFLLYDITFCSHCQLRASDAPTAKAFARPSLTFRKTFVNNLSTSLYLISDKLLPLFYNKIF